MRGSEVVSLQEFLKNQGIYTGPITGNYFALTYKAVRGFQIRERITPASGYFGPVTRTKANTILSQQSQSAFTAGASISATADTSVSSGSWLQNQVSAATYYARRIFGKKRPPSSDTVSPSVTLSSTSGSITNTSIPVTISFSESVTGFTISDIAVQNGSAKNFSGSSSKYAVTIVPLADGTVSVQVPASVASDAAGNANLASSLLSRTYDRTLPIVNGLSDYLTPSKSVTWTWSSEAGATFRYLIDMTQSAAPSGTFGAVTSANQLTGTGTYYIHVQARDVAGNRSEVVTAKAVLDNSASTSPPPPPTSGEVYLNAYTTAYTYWDNTPPGSADISHPVIHQKAGGIGTYADPVTLAVGHSIISGEDILDYPAGTIFYIPNVRRYFIVEDTCGDGNTPQNGPCHIGYPAGTSTWVDLWIDGASGSASQSNACAEAITDSNGVAHTIIKNPASTYAVVSGAVFQNGSCAQQYGNIPVTQ